MMNGLKKVYLWFIPILFFVAIAFVVIGYPRDSVLCETITDPFPTRDPNGNYLTNPTVTIGKVCSFSGKLKRGESFQKKITQRLVFCLTPSSFWVENGGWDLNISDEIGKPCDDNFAGIVTPPYRGGDNATFIQGWNFRNENNTGKSEANAITSNSMTRFFSFVFNQSDYEAIFNYSFNIPTDSNVDASKILTSRGVLTIIDLKLGNLIPNETAWIESMKFEVKIYLPSD
jgi:hypothetical protein